MEKTKGLTMTEDEKRELKEREVSGKVIGLVRKYLDGLVSLEKFEVETAAAAKENSELVSRTITEESLSRFVLGDDNQKLMSMLDRTTEVDWRAIETILENLEDKLEKERILHAGALEEDLKKRGISGSAVIPNLAANQAWQECVLKLNQEFQEQVRVLVES
jgi:hypothetical protein